MKNKVFSIRRKSLDLKQLHGFIKDATGMYGVFGCTVAEFYKLVNDALLTKPSYLDNLEIMINDAKDPNDIAKLIIGSAFGLDDFTDLTVERVDGLQKKMSIYDLGVLVDNLLNNPDYKVLPDLFPEHLKEKIRSCERQWGRRATVQQFLNQDLGSMFVSNGSCTIDGGYYKTNIRYKHGMGFIEISTDEGFKRKVTFNTLATMMYKIEALTQ